MTILPAHDAAYWRRVYGGRNPGLLLRKGVQVPPDAYFEYVLPRLKVQAKKEDFSKFEGSNGCVAWAFAKAGAPEKTEEDYLGQPLVRADVIVSWNPSIRSYKGMYYDFLAYLHEKDGKK